MLDGRNAPPTKYVATDGGHVAYQVFGDGPTSVLFISNWLSNLDVMWDEPALAAYLRRLAEFSRVVCFDKRGSGVSDPVQLATRPTLEQWMDDAIAALDAAGVDEVALIGDTEGGPMAMLLAASFPERVSALVLVNSYARWRRADDYPIGMPERTTAKLIERWEQNWGITSEILGFTAPTLADDERARRWFGRYQRLAMPPGVAVVMYRWVLGLDVRDILGNIAVPTLVLHRRDARHHRIAFGRYLAEHIPEAQFVELDGADTFPFHAGDTEPLLSAIEVFLTGTTRPPPSSRRLATVLMSDIVGSTTLVSQLGDARWRERLRDHDAVVRGAVARYRGDELVHTGDGIVASFDGPTRAVTCARYIVDALADLGLTVRIGLHAGEVEIGPQGASGLALHIAARVMGVAVDGGILASRTVRDLVFGSGLAFVDRGEHQLRGVPGSWSLFEVVDTPATG
ncbi:MAG TPA: adenylate/guanylate cyclase domain-containing protein [Euzebyales bacterium]|nr:adenylate/guanylate cyclase domain-containing protein [Euzebyales bacterium]